MAEPRAGHGVLAVLFGPGSGACRCCRPPTQIDADLQLLSGKVTAVRTYSSLKSLAPRARDRRPPSDLKVALGAWLDRHPATNEQEVAAAIELANKHANVIRLVIGNEAILRGDLTVAELTRQLDRVRAAVKQPVSTAEPWHVWLKHPELAEHVDYIAVHLLPYWEGIAVEHGDRLSGHAHGPAAAARFPASASSSPKSAGPRMAARAKAPSRRPATKRCSCGGSSQRAETKATSTT